ncbi:unnamed protein product [Parascedosporium putredinis]|uniref:Uncharacterized protein n=1 Tax=Parascedosporium putredinis TaxID=1442378 RepID=A0A9P1MD44_9PEZI|nr:unnamed protein product [Parascedosporium putredinis]CAI8001914.1 unnamed protein product [Parascedosporium putredinis]
MSLFTGQLYPKRALGFLALGASLHDILTRLKAEPTRFPQLELVYSRETPIDEPVTVNLPANGIRLRFDGAQQRLRLIEVLDFSRNHITFNDRDLVRPATAAPAAAFTFKLSASAYSPDKDVVSLLSAVPNQTATSMAVFDGPSWAEARPTLWTATLPSIKSNPAIPRSKDVPADEISLVRIHGGGAIQLFHQSSLMTGSEDTNDEEAVEEDSPGHVSGECFYNYFYLGFDVLVSTPTTPSRRPPGYNRDGTVPEKRFTSASPDKLVATKLVLHGNLPGSYEFNRHRRCCWDIAYLEDPASETLAPNSEAKFTEIEEALNERWKSLYPEGESEGRQRGMVLNRGWGDSPGSSCELLGGWEDSSATAAANLPKGADGSDDATTTLFGFPGLVFEVLRNGHVNTVTVF